MAVIEQVIDTLTFSSTYSCRDKYDYFDSASPETEESWETHDVSVTTASIDTRNLTFSYNSIENETINIVVFSMESIDTTFGGTIWVNDKVVYKSGDKYVAYLDSSIVGLSSTEVVVKFQTYTPKHYHHYNYDSKSDSYGYDYTEGSYGGAVYTKHHTGVLTVNNITLKIYTGDDFVSVPSTSALYIGVGGVAKKITEMYASVNGIAKKISGSWIGIRGIAQEFQPCLELQHIIPGEIVQIDETGMGTLVDYIVVAQDHYLNETNTERHTVLMRKNLLNTATQYGNNSWGESYVGESLDVYVNEAWKATLDGRIILKLMNITIPCNQWSSPYHTTAERQVWVPSRDEVDETYTGKYEGPCFEYFIGKNTDADRKAYTDDGTAQTWWTRSCVEGMGSDGAYIRVINASGVFNNFGQKGNYYCRPVFCLPAGLPISKVSEGIYNLVL